jgi:hypothetical protein
MTHLKMSDDSLAVTSAGSVLVNVTHLGQRGELNQLVEFAQGTGRRIFIGVELLPDETKTALEKFDHMAAEIVATVVYRERG